MVQDSRIRSRAACHWLDIAKVMGMVVGMVALGADPGMARTADDCRGGGQIGDGAGSIREPLTPPQAGDPGFVDVRDAGARGDGSADDTDALQQAFETAGCRNLPVHIPTGTYRYDRSLKIKGVRITGDGPRTRLIATQETDRTLNLTGQNVSLENLSIEGPAPTSRFSIAGADAVRVIGAKGLRVSQVTLTNSSKVGIFIADSRDGWIQNNKITNTAADSIHMTKKSSAIRVCYNTIRESGDDGVAVVSYGRDVEQTNNILIKKNDIADQRWGRFISVVGGRNVAIIDNQGVGNRQGSAGIMIASESAYKTLGVENVFVGDNRIEGAGSKKKGHSGVMVSADSAGITNVKIANNQISKNAAPGLIVEGRWPAGVVAENNRFGGQGQDVVLRDGQALERADPSTLRRLPIETVADGDCP